MSRGRGRGRGGFGSVKLGANSIEIPESMDIQCHEILLFPVLIMNVLINFFH
jgi:hypothetical protein